VLLERSKTCEVVLTNLASAAREADTVVTDMSWVHDTALGPFGDGTRGNVDLGVSTDVLVEDLGAVKHGFGSDTLGLREVLLVSGIA
jgi:hypothetical protein